MLDFVIASRKGTELKRVPLQFERRLRTSAAIDLWGFDATHALATHVRAQRSGSWTLDMRTEGTPLTASQSLLLLDLFEVLASRANRVALTRPGSSPAGTSGLQDVSTGEPPPEGFPEAIRALALLEQHVGTPIFVPEIIEQPALSDLLVAGMLLGGHVVPVQWEELEWPITVGQAKDLAASALGFGPAVLDITKPFTVDLGAEQRYEIAVWHHYRSVRVATWPKLSGNEAADDQVAVRLVPADPDGVVDLRFEPGEAGLDGEERGAAEDEPVTTVPGPIFEDLVASLDIEEEPAPALARAAARLRAIRA